MNKLLVKLGSLLASLIQVAKWRLQDMPKLHTSKLERRVRKQLQLVTNCLNEAIRTASNHTCAQTPSLDEPISYAKLKFKLIGKPTDGIVEVSYTGSQANSYLDVLKYGVADICQVLKLDFDPGPPGKNPNITATLQLPVQAFFH